MGDKPVPAVLMMSAEGHLPSRERHEHDTIGADEAPDLLQEGYLVGDMFNHVVAYHQVEGLFGLFHLEEVQTDKLSRKPLGRETFFRCNDIIGIQIDARHIASTGCYGGKIATHTTTDLQDTQPGLQGDVLIDKGDEELLTRP